LSRRREFHPEKEALKFYFARMREKKCFIFVQTVSSAMIIAVRARLIRLFHKLFNKTVENFSRANRTRLL
jgi:hypothetical protein